MGGKRNKKRPTENRAAERRATTGQDATNGTKSSPSTAHKKRETPATVIRKETNRLAASGKIENRSPAIQTETSRPTAEMTNEKSWAACQTNAKRNFEKQAAVTPASADHDQKAANPPIENQPAANPDSTPPVRPGQLHDAVITGLTHEGMGVARVDGFALFVPGALPGERVRVKVTGVKKNYGEAELADILRPSPDRVAPFCPVFGTCGGCQLQHMSYKAQLEAKRRWVEDSLRRIGKLEGVPVHPVIGMDEPWHYRNKLHMPVGSRDGRLVAGFYTPGTRELVETDDCLLGPSRMIDTVRAVRRIAGELGISAWNPDTGRGMLRHIVVRISRATGEVMVVLVAACESLPRQDELIGLLRMEIDGLASLCLNVNKGPAGVVLGERTLTLWGSDTIRDTIGGIEFAISPRSFFQVNPVQTEKLYGKALEYAGLGGDETVIDAYCGIGTISLFLARHARRVYGVEIVPEAVEDARINARINNIRNVTFETGKAEVVLPRWQKQGVRADVIVVDPPRKGCDRRLLETIIAMRPKRVVYVSCNPATLARDLRILEDGGFHALEAQPVDMFPQTGHVECVTLMLRVEE